MRLPTPVSWPADRVGARHPRVLRSRPLAYPLEEKYLQPWTTETLEKAYDYFEDDLIPCLEAEGYPIEDVPSRGTFLDSYFDTGWTPYRDAFTGQYSQEECYRVLQLCPQWPVDLYD